MTNKVLDLFKSNNILIENIVVILGIVSIIMFIAVVVLIILQIRSNGRYKKFMAGSDGKSLEEQILSKIEKVDSFNGDVKKIFDRIDKIEENLLIAIQKVGVVKYDAFKEMGGKLSFALALLTLENNGIVINSVHSREGCYTYIKEIIKGESFVLLADEEKEAVEQAVKSDNFME